MDTTTIRISKKSRNVLKEISSSTGQTMNSIVEKAIEKYYIDKFWDNVDKAFIKLKNNTSEWKEELEERKLWEMTLSDGLQED